MPLTIATWGDGNLSCEFFDLQLGAGDHKLHWGHQMADD